MSRKLRIAINTGGGDAPGLNAVIYAVTMAATGRGWEVYGIPTGYAGLLDTSKIVPLTPERVAGIAPLGGTILGTTNRGDPFRLPTRNAAGQLEYVDVSDRLIQNFRRFGLDVLVAVGGDGSLSLAHRLSERGLPVIGVPKTIDNDLSSTLSTFGFDTAVSTATEAIDKLHSTASAHERVFVVEVMGRYAGWIALHSGAAGSADVILIPEIPFDIDKVCERILENERKGKRYAIVVAAEGAKWVGGEMVTKPTQSIGRAEVLLGGIGDWVAAEIAKRTEKETRSLVLGHLQRGGWPTAFDRLLALRFGAAAVRFIADGLRNVMVSLRPPDMVAVPLAEVIQRTKTVSPDSDTILTCKDIGVSFGD
ncbi:MAG TPA: ATP-dependent 6-phosphofructokinase [Anaeromyxobacteraceae bacterium]|nr:ATP-dependent 6-phosphofructokinase [Anaeromyxobacteraceae bacterium]